MNEFDTSEDARTTATGALDRREFLKRVGGGVVVLFTTVPRFSGAETPAEIAAAEPAFNAYLRIGADGRVTCFTGKIENTIQCRIDQ